MRCFTCFDFSLSCVSTSTVDRYVLGTIQVLGFITSTLYMKSGSTNNHQYLQRKEKNFLLRTILLNQLLNQLSSLFTLILRLLPTKVTRKILYEIDCSLTYLPLLINKVYITCTNFQWNLFTVTSAKRFDSTESRKILIILLQL